AFVLADRQLEFVNVVRAAEEYLLLIMGQHFQTVHREVEVVTLQSGDEAFEIVVFEVDRPTHFAFQRGDKIDLEAEVSFRVGGILKDVGRSARLVGGPEKRPRLLLAPSLLGSQGGAKASQEHDAQPTRSFQGRCPPSPGAARRAERAEASDP